MIFRIVEKSGQIFLLFCHNSRVWQIDGQTDSFLIARPRLHLMQRGKNASLEQRRTNREAYGIDRRATANWQHEQWEARSATGRRPLRARNRLKTDLKPANMTASERSQKIFEGVVVRVDYNWQRLMYNGGIWPSYYCRKHATRVNRYCYWSH